jgi:hypothetical protein
MFMNRRVVLVVGSLLGTAPCGGAASAAADGLYQSASGVAAYLGVVPAEITKGHEPTQPQGPMHGGVRDGGYQYHLVAAVFDASSGERITDATVTAQVSALGVGGPTKALEPMTIAGAITYGAYFNLRTRDLYIIVLAIKRPEAGQPITLKFTYDHRNR